MPYAEVETFLILSFQLGFENRFALSDEPICTTLIGIIGKNWSCSC